MQGIFNFVLSFCLTTTFTGVSPGPLDSREKLIEIKVEPLNNEIQNVHLDLSDVGSIINFVRQGSNGVQVIPGSDLQKGEVVVARASDHDALLLSCVGCSMQDGGILKLKYLDNGVFNSYKTVQYRLVHAPLAWELYTMDDIQIRNLTVLSRTFAGKVVGIKEIKVNAY